MERVLLLLIGGFIFGYIAGFFVDCLIHWWVNRGTR